MTISIIVAKSINNVIGKDNKLIWHLPNDLKYFKTITTGKPVIMGRKNYLSIPEKFRPLPNRVNIVLTRQKSFEAPGCILKNSLEDAILFCKENNHEECFIIGGGEVYKQAMDKDLADKLYITEVFEKFEGDTFFPELDLGKWQKISSQHNQTDATHRHNYSFDVYEKKH
jgi:dihydrofolate reductase